MLDTDFATTDTSTKPPNFCFTATFSCFAWLQHKFVKLDIILSIKAGCQRGFRRPLSAGRSSASTGRIVGSEEGKITIANHNA